MFVIGFATHMGGGILQQQRLAIVPHGIFQHHHNVAWASINNQENLFFITSIEFFFHPPVVRRRWLQGIWVVQLHPGKIFAN